MARRIIILGGPRVGKTTLSQTLKSELGIPAHHSDDLKHLDWSEQSAEAAKWFSDSGDWICEGVQMARGLRKWLLANPDTQLDVDILRLNRPYETLLDGQASMTKGIETVFREIEKELTRRGARVHELSDPSEALRILERQPTWGRDKSDSLGEKRMALKANLTKEEFEALAEPLREHYKASQDETTYTLEAEGVEDVTGLKASQQKLLDEVKALKKAAEAFKDIDPEKHRQMLADAEEKARDNKKKSGDWDGWKKTFEEGKEKEVKALQDEISSYKQRIQQILLVDKAKTAFLEAGGRKVSTDRMVRDLLNPTAPRLRLDDSEKIEILDESGNPIDLKIDSFFKDIYKQEASEFYDPIPGGSGAGASKGLPAGTDLSKLSPTERLKVANRAGP